MRAVPAAVAVLACGSGSLHGRRLALTLAHTCAAQMKRLEALGLTRGQAEALTQHLTVVLCSNREKLEEFYASKVALEMVRALLAG